MCIFAWTRCIGFGVFIFYFVIQLSWAYYIKYRRPSLFAGLLFEVLIIVGYILYPKFTIPGLVIRETLQGRNPANNEGRLYSERRFT